MNLSFDKFENYEVPQITLCNPNSRATNTSGKITITDTVGVLSNLSGMNLKLNFNAPHELSFDYCRHKSSDSIKQSFYDSIYEAIQTDRYIYLTDIGYFTISGVTDSDEDNIDKRSITCKSCEENEFATAEGLYLEEGTYYLHTQDNKGLLDLFLPKTAGWTMGYIDPSLLTKPYYVEKTDVDNGYNFLYTTIQDMFECIVEADIITRIISVYSRAYYAEHHLTDIHIAKYNLLKHKTVEENDEDKYTALNVQGKDENLEIRSVNPTGKNIIYNFEPRYAWMSSNLQEAVQKWQEKCESVENEYLELQEDYYEERQLLFNEEKDIEVLKLGLQELQSTRDFITSGAADNYLTSIKTYCDQYNSHVNGNVDYAKRPFISPKEMIAAGYPEFEDPDMEVATTYDCDYSLVNGSGVVLYTIKMTPIKEDRTVLSVEDLDSYFDTVLSSYSSKAQLLSADANHSKLIINIADGDTPRDAEGLTDLDKVLMPIKNNHWSTVKAFMKASGLEMSNLSNVLNEIENRQTALSHTNSAISAKQTQINSATTSYNTHKATVYTNYEVPIAQINADCALDITAIDIDGNLIFTAELLNELMTHIKPTDYVDEYMLVTDSMTYPQRFEKAKELMDRAKSQLVKISSGQKTYSIDTRSFLFNKQFKHFSEQLCAGAIIYVETKSDTMEQLHLTGIDINYDEKSTNFTLGNKYDRSDLKALYDDALGKNSKSFTELKYIASIIEDQQKQLDYQQNWAEQLRTLTLDNVLTSEDQAIEINNRGLTGRKRRLKQDGSWDEDENGNPLFEAEQVKLINNTLVFTEDNWEHAATAVGKIAIGYDEHGDVQYAYGINGQVLIGELILGNNLVLTGTGAGIHIKDGNNNDAFYADANGNLVLSGTIIANQGSIAGFTIGSGGCYSNALFKRTTDNNNQYEVGMKATSGYDDYAFYVKKSTDNWQTKTNTFYIANNGKLYASNAEITGTITANSGSIGGFNIGSYNTYSDTLYKVTTDNKYWVGIKGDPGSGTYLAFYAKEKINGSWENNFYVRNDGTLYATKATITGQITATSGKIGDWTISGGEIKCAQSTNVYFKLCNDSNNTWIEAKNGNNNWPFQVTKSGVLKATGAEISGTIKAGSIIASGYLTDGTSGFYLRSQDKKQYLLINNSYAQLWHNTYGEVGFGSSIYSHGSSIYQAIISCTSGNKGAIGGNWYVEGNIYNSSGSNAISSDINKKNSINNISNKYDNMFNNLKPITFKYNEGTSNRIHVGFIAQEVKVSMDIANIDTSDFAGLVIDNKNTDNENWYLRYEEFIALNTWQIQKAKARITELESTVAELKTQIQNLTAE